jgi:ankyrin repeat protein
VYVAVSDSLQLMHQYVGLADMLYIPKQVVEALTALRASSRVTKKAEIDFQLGLCHAVGFGVDCNYDKTIQLFSASAAGGFRKARMLLRRVAAALGIALDPGVERLTLTWSSETQDEANPEASGRLLVPSPPHGLVSATSGHQLMKSGENLPTNATPTSNMRLVEAIKLGQLEEVEIRVQECEDVNLQLGAGETALHYAVLSPDSRIAATILQAGADVSQCTAADCEISIAGSDGHQIPPNVSPMALTVLLDRVDLLDIFLQHTIRGQSEAGKNETLIGLLAWGAQYQSISCIGYLCEQLHSKPVRPFDDLGVNPLSYAVRADFLFRLVLFTSDTNRTHPNISPVIDRQLRVVEMLLEAGFPLSADESTGLNCLHIAAATSDVALLNLLLKYRKNSGPNEVEEISPEGFSPLGIAITRGREDVYGILVDAGADHHNAWPEIRGDALHCCAFYPSAASVSIATQILKKHPKAVNVRDGMWRTPLHCAAFRENNEMIEILINARADIAARDIDSYTPLGAAVSGRSIRAIRQICAALKRKRQPLVSWAFMNPIVEISWLTYSPLEQLLSPGTISPAREPEMRLEPNRTERFGCCDHPFSRKSLKVLQILLDCYEHRTRPTINFFEHMFFSIDRYSGIESAVSMGNIEAVKLILQSGKFSHDHRYLVLYAHNQRMVGASHIADEATREDMLDYLEEYHDKWFKSRLERRRSSWLSLVWKLYYTCYGDLEQEQWKRASLWLRNNRFLDYRPVVLEFVPWARTRWSLSIVSFSIGWIFMAPMIVYFILIHQAPPTECPRSRKIYAIICLVMVSSMIDGHVVVIANKHFLGEHLSSGTANLLGAFGTVPALQSAVSWI